MRLEVTIEDLLSVRGGGKSPQNTKSGGLMHSQVQVGVPKHLLCKAKVSHCLLITCCSLVEGVRNESGGALGVVDSYDLF